MASSYNLTTIYGIIEIEKYDILDIRIGRNFYGQRHIQIDPIACSLNLIEILMRVLI